MFFSRYKSRLSLCLLSTVLLVSSATNSISQTNKYESVYAKSYKNVGKDVYSKKLITLSLNNPDKNWKYQGGELRTIDSLFHFNNDMFCHDFPTNTSKLTNDYLIYYFSQKQAKCPVLFSLLNYYEQILDKELFEKGLPKELKFIPVICSGFNPNSDNGIGGIGYWHLNHPQAVRYGLTINEYVDERKDFKKSTQAAAAYIKDLHHIYNNWELTLAAYSSGVVNVNKLLKRYNAKTYKAIADHLPTETKDFVQAFVAINFIYSYDNYGAVTLNPTIEADTIIIERKLMMKAINDVIKTKSSDYHFLNPVLTTDVFPNNYAALFPKGKGEKFTTMKDSIYFYQDSVLLKPEPEEPAYVVPKDGEPFEYTVKSGDVLGLIAGRFNVRVSDIQAWNNLSGTRINIGQKLMIYGKKKVTQPKPNTSNKSKEEPKETTTTELKFDNGKYTIYTVKSGDNLWLIAKNYPGVSADDIMEYNGIDNNLDVGQKLKIPKP